jgi:hypothetical protein
MQTYEQKLDCFALAQEQRMNRLEQAITNLTRLMDNANKDRE